MEIGILMNKVKQLGQGCSPVVSGLAFYFDLIEVYSFCFAKVLEKTKKQQSGDNISWQTQGTLPLIDRTKQTLVKTSNFLKGINA